jgi:hypothetical protein
MLLEKITVSQLVKKFPLLWNSEVHYRIHKSPPPFHILSHINPVHITTLPEEHFQYYPSIYV